MSRPTADIVADCRASDSIHAREAADRLAELEADLRRQMRVTSHVNDQLPPCPTCGGTQVLWPRSGTGHASAGLPCPDCTYGRVSIERMAAELEALDAARPVCPTCDGSGYGVDSGGMGGRESCPDCVDGKMPLEREHAIVNAVFRHEANSTINYLRSVKPT